MYTTIFLLQAKLRSSVHIRGREAILGATEFLRGIPDLATSEFIYTFDRWKLTITQVITIATPLALDLDERLMPEPAAYPRPRRTRPRTAPANMDITPIPNVPPSYPTENSDTLTQEVSDARRSARRSLDIIS
jgi:hypothetical protein